ncbi:MAG TPA: glycosyltransferase family 2 protein [Puia sp.]|jgi:glycosyltransferase involved in cell wall biosynthesis|uniref:glycosyltransferase family 2 protein n=1 Tax=Puia sp. TaxID=2045100 RepID=UPI002CFB013F|nr:glycosyltransferase family 2 protein [Puia sp.]HVU95077.1 glycosyltransferase family 2 protein [Puia sp.]
MRPISIPASIRQHLQSNSVLLGNVQNIRERFKRLQQGTPEISVVIPAYNEEENILRTLSSLSCTTSQRSLEFIVVDNNSRDATASLVKAVGITCIHEPRQGIAAARNTGLRAARGKLIINADADTIYPPAWIDEMVRPLERSATAVCYGRFSFIPVGNTNRFVYFFYEYAADMLRYFNKFFREEAVNVYGFNSSFRRDQGLEVDGFDHPPQASEDGWLALKLRNKGFGKLHYVTNIRALVWTTDRRNQIDGGLWKALGKKAKRIFLGKR